MASVGLLTTRLWSWFPSEQSSADRLMIMWSTDHRPNYVKFLCMYIRVLWAYYWFLHIMNREPTRAPFKSDWPCWHSAPSQQHLLAITAGRKPRGTGGTVPKKFEVWDGPCIRPPNIFRSRPSVVGCAWKYGKSKKGVIKELETENPGKERENPENLVND